MAKTRLVITIKEAMERVIDPNTGKPISGREVSRRADEAGNYIRHRTIHEWMSGKAKHLVADHIPTLCEVLGCGIEDLMRLEPVEDATPGIKMGIRMVGDQLQSVSILKDSDPDDKPTYSYVDHGSGEQE